MIDPIAVVDEIGMRTITAAFTIHDERIGHRMPAAAPLRGADFDATSSEATCPNVAEIAIALSTTSFIVLVIVSSLNLTSGP